MFLYVAAIFFFFPRHPVRFASIFEIEGAFFTAIAATVMTTIAGYRAASRQGDTCKVMLADALVALVLAAPSWVAFPGACRRCLGSFGLEIRSTVVVNRTAEWRPAGGSPGPRRGRGIADRGARRAG